MKIFISCVVVLLASLTLNIFMIQEHILGNKKTEQLNNKIEQLNNEIGQLNVKRGYLNNEKVAYEQLIYVKRYIAQKKLNLDLDFVIESLYIIAACRTSILSNQHIVENEQTLLFDKILEEELHDLLFLLLTNYKNNINSSLMLNNWSWMRTCLLSNKYKKEQTNSLIKEIEAKFKKNLILTSHEHYHYGRRFLKEKKYNDAFFHLSEAAKKGHPYADVDLRRNEGIFKQHGIILKPEDIRNVLRVDIARIGNYYLGCRLLKEKKYNDAFFYLSIAAKAGDPDAGTELQRNKEIFKQHGIILKPEDIRTDDSLIEL